MSTVVVVEGPIVEGDRTNVEGTKDYLSYYRFHSFDQDDLKKSVYRQMRVDRVELVIGATFFVSLLGEAYVLRVADVLRGDGEGQNFCVTVRHDRNKDQNLHAVSVSSTQPVLIHGLPEDFRPPKQGHLFWHTLDLFSWDPNEDCLWNIARSVGEGGCVVLWPVDFVDHRVIEKFLKNLSQFSVQVVLLAHRLVDVGSSVFALVDEERVVKWADREGVGMIGSTYERNAVFGKSPEIIVPPEVAVSHSVYPPIPFPPCALPSCQSTLRTYFLTPFIHKSAVSVFSKAIPSLAAPKVLIHSSSVGSAVHVARWALGELLAADPSVNVVAVSASRLFSRYFGSSEKRIDKLFRKAAAASPCVLLIEGVHLLCANREDQEETGVADTYSRVLAAFLMNLDGVDMRSRGVAVLATSLVDPMRLDPAATRPGRLEVWLTVGQEEHVKEEKAVVDDGDSDQAVVRAHSQNSRPNSVDSEDSKD